MYVRILAIALGLVLGGAASAQSPGTPAEFYFEDDPTTLKPVVALRGEGDLTQKLVERLQRNPRARAEAAQLAHIAMEAGRHDLGRDLYDRALARLDQNDLLWRPVLWNYGWDLYRAGDADGALRQWSTLANARSSNASWVPPTLALALWSAGRREEAVQWYAAAVRTEPGKWSDSPDFARLLPDWREAERATLAEVQAAWAANPPAWP